MSEHTQGLMGAIALVMFLSIFLLVVAYMLHGGNQETFRRARQLPLDDARLPENEVTRT